MKTLLFGCGVLFLCGGTALSSEITSAPDLNPVTFKNPPAGLPVTLVADGKPVAKIVMPAKGSSRQLEGAARELADCFKAATGAAVEIVRGPAQGPAIVIGNGPEALEAGLDGARMPVEGFAIKTGADRVYIVGNDEVVDAASNTRSEGTAWGVYEFAERFLGVRWYFPTNRGGRSITPMPTVTLAPVWLEDAPVFRLREIWPPCQDSWNGSGQQLGELHACLRSGNSWPIRVVVHSSDWSRDAACQKDRPEVFQLKSDGQRDYSMLCFGNARTLETYLEQIAACVENKKPARFISGSAITVSPSDAQISCYCEDCRKLWDNGGGPYGTASRIMATFVDRLAREVRKRWPDMTVVFLPYLNYTRAPEGFKFPGNVEVQICGMPGLAQYKEPAINAAQQANIDAWFRISGRRIQTWDYSCWPEDKTKAAYLFPHVIQAYYLRNRDKMVGSFINGVTDHWPRQGVSLYCWMKLLWNPEFNVDAAMDEYCCRMFGSAAATMRELVRMQTDGWEKSRWPEGRLSPKSIYEVSFPRKDVVAMERLLDQARKQAAGNEEALRRVEYYATPFPAFFTESRNHAEGTGFQPLLAQKVGENPKMDGRLDYAVWEGAKANAFVLANDRAHKECAYPTTLKAVWTAHGVTFGFRMAEPTPDQLKRKYAGRDEPAMWWDDCVELLMDVTGKNTGDYYHFMFNSNGACFDAHGEDFSWNAEGVKTATYIGKDFWSMTIFIPFQAFPDAVRPGSGTNTKWYGSFTRHRVADTLPEDKTKKPAPGSVAEYQRMNTTGAGPSNNLADFAPIQFME